jgi:hypothetical protein
MMISSVRAARTPSPPTYLQSLSEQNQLPSYKELMMHINYRLHATSRELHEWTRSDEKAAVAAVSDYANGEDEKKRTRGAELGGEEAVVCGC